jgi:hypothetical protein
LLGTGVCLNFPAAVAAAQLPFSMFAAAALSAAVMQAVAMQRQKLLLKHAARHLGLPCRAGNGNLANMQRQELARGSYADDCREPLAVLLEQHVAKGTPKP